LRLPGCGSRLNCFTNSLLEKMTEKCSLQTMKDQSEKILLRKEIAQLKGEVAKLRDSQVNNAKAAGVSGSSTPASENGVGTSSGVNAPTTPARSVSPGVAKIISDMFVKLQKELARTVTGIIARPDRFEGSRSRGRSSTRDTRSIANPGTRRVRIPDDPDPDDPGDEDDDSNNSGSRGRRDQSRDQFDSEDDDLRYNDGSPVTITVNRVRTRSATVTETRRSREQDFVKVPPIFIQSPR